MINQSVGSGGIGENQLPSKIPYSFPTCILIPNTTANHTNKFDRWI